MNWAKIFEACFLPTGGVQLLFATTILAPASVLELIEAALFRSVLPFIPTDVVHSSRCAILTTL